MKHHEFTDPANDSEISLIDILRFLKNSYKTIIITGLSGLLISVVYLTVTPKKYEAVAQVVMAQINNSSANKISVSGVNVEQPSQLIIRLSSPTSFTPLVLDNCDIGGSPASAAALAKSIKLTSPKGSANLVELKAFGSSPQSAKSCASAIFELIKVSQAKIIAPSLMEAKLRLDYYEERLTKAKDQLLKIDKSGVAAGVFYAYSVDEIRFLREEIMNLQEFMSSAQTMETRLNAPIYAGAAPIAPQKRIALTSGLLSGLGLGLLIVIVRHMWVKLKVET